MTAPLFYSIPRLGVTRIACAGGLLLCLLCQTASALSIINI